MKYKIKVGDRFLLWVDECWYETEKEGGVFFDTIEDVKTIIRQMNKHYRFDVKVLEIDFDKNTEKEIDVKVKPKLIIPTIANKSNADFGIKCVISF